MSVDGPRADGGADDQIPSSNLKDVGEGTPSVPPAPSTETIDPHTVSRLPEKIGQFHVKSLLATGGMGTIYRAAQEHPRRTVAVKVMKHGITSRSAMRRFEYESQILARLHHPGIAQVYEAGTHTPSPSQGEGRGEGLCEPVPYFAMEYIPNARPITDHAREKKLGTRECLELFTHVCDAVHHGHQKAIIHRDLKPGNILVDSQGEVKIIDFGVARGTDSDMAVTTLQTDIGQLIGTLQYMSPEQCEADPDDLDTRSDVYALGVVLYELVSGKLPYEVARSQIYEATRVIREQEPTKLTTINKALRGDVETIVFKALEKDRDRRYQSAFGLAQDIRRYLSGEAIAARPPSIVYQFRVFARKNKGLFGAAAGMFLILVAGVIVSTSMYLRSEANRVIAQKEATKARTTLGFLEERLRAVDPNKARGREVTVHSMLDEAARQIEAGELADQPEAEASLRATLGQTYTSLGLYDAAEPHLRAALSIRKRVLGDEHADVARSLHDLGNLHLGRYEFDAAEPFFDQALAMRRKLLGEEHRDTLWSMRSRAWLLSRQVKLHEAKSLARKTLETQKRVLGPEDRDTLKSMNLLAIILDWQGQSDQAEALYRTAFERMRRVLGEDSIDTWSAASNLGELLAAAGDYAEAEPLLRQSLAMYRKLLGDEHQDVCYPLLALVSLLRAMGQYQEAEKLIRELLELDRGALGEQHPLSRQMLFLLAQILAEQGNLDEASVYVSQAFAGYRRRAERPNTTAENLNVYAWELLIFEVPELRDPEAALPIAMRAVEKTRGQDAYSLDTLALAYKLTGDIDKAVETQTQALDALPPGGSALRVDIENKLVSFLREK
ncbi:MAG: tetratricopeptide repeat protein, partial [Planctomycetota bacterium]